MTGMTGVKGAGIIEPGVKGKGMTGIIEPGS